MGKTVVTLNMSWIHFIEKQNEKWGTIFNIRLYDPHKWQRNDHMRKLPVLSNAPLCALPKKKILQVNITAASDRELNPTPNRSQSIFYFILHIYSPSCATLPDSLRIQTFCFYILCVCVCIGHIHIYIYIHTFILHVMIYGAQNHWPKVSYD